MAFFPYEETDNNDKLTHIVNPPANMHIWQEGMSAQEIVDIARVLQEAVICLCGASFVPSRDPERYPICQPCVDIAGAIDRSM